MPEANSQRDQTDESLRAERVKTDAELEKKRETLERSADALVVKARDRADDVLQAARASADELAPAPPTASLRAERSLADDALESEHKDADARLHAEREARRRALTNLLRLEREETDQDLLTERGGNDHALDSRDEFLAMASHDLRTLLGGIALSAALIRKEAALEDGSKSSVASRAETIQRIAARMNRLIGDLVDVASIEAGKLQIAPVRADVRAVVEEAAAIFQPNAEHAGLELVAPPGPPLFAPFDHERVLQVLANLLGNALKFTPRGGRITVGAVEAEGEVRVFVQDTGPGIDATQLEAIFGKFWQGTRHDRRSLGLGLYISRSIVEAHGGKIWAESTPPRGSTLSFSLPQQMPSVDGRTATTDSPR